MKLRPVPIMLLLGLGLSSAYTSIDSAYEPGVAWSKKRINVCWGQARHREYTFLRETNGWISEYTPSQKTLIQTIISQEFSAESTGIEFVGWEDCDEEVKKSDVVLLKVHSEFDSQGRATIGEKGAVVGYQDEVTLKSYREMVKNNSPLRPFLLLNTYGSDSRKINSSQYLQLLALHEFGHLAGLRHEHIRFTEALKDPNCRLVPELKIQEEEVFQSTRFSYQYDYNSVMNYCYINSLINVTGLTFRARSSTSWLKLTDESIFSATPTKKRIQFDIRLGLSMSDKNALKCMYHDRDQLKNIACSVKP